jgi:aspartyl-tRNA(Asn)/glutamyl-tRNA(Gln) amidotransferase subunit C
MDDKQIVEYVAKLARVSLSKEEEEKIAGQFHKILEYVNKLKECDVSGVEPMRAAVPERDVLRQDEVVPSTLSEDILNNAPSREGNYFKVAKIIE